MRSYDPFLPGSNPTADAAACLQCLQQWNLGVVQSVLSYERIHAEAVTAGAVKLGRHLPDQLDLLCAYGSVFLSNDELKLRVEEVLTDYYLWLAVGAIHLRGREFWKYHSARMAGLSFRLEAPRLAYAVLMKVLDLLGHPDVTLAKIRRWLTARAPAASARHPSRPVSPCEI